MKKIIRITLKIAKDIYTLMNTYLSIRMMEHLSNSDTITSGQNCFTIKSP